MKFLSIKEYFYKLNTIGFILLLIPLALFIFLYYYAINHAPQLADHDSVFFLLAAFAGLAVLELTILQWMWRARINKLRKLIELARKMDGYFLLVLVKMSVYGGCFLMMCLGYFLTGNSWFTGLFLTSAIVLIFQWPTPSSFCRHFNLVGSERDMMLNNRDLYQKKK